VACLLKAGIVTGQEQTYPEIKTGLEELKATGFKTNPEGKEAIPGRQEVPSGNYRSTGGSFWGPETCRQNTATHGRGRLMSMLREV
jgi:hypothetical protein